MLQIKFLVVLLVTALISPIATAISSDESDNSFTLYFIRHAEKDLHHHDRKDPPLASCGIKRSQNIKSIFEPLKLSAVYSSNYQRTIDTARPTAENQNVDVEFYNPSELNDIHKILLNKKQNALIVGHSNTTSKLAELFTGDKYDIIPENTYNRIYQISVINGIAQLQVLEQTYQCS